MKVARDAKLDRLKTAQDQAFQCKQRAWERQQSAWERRSQARDAMNRAYDAQQSAYDRQDRAWQHYQSVRNSNGPRIDYLNRQQESAYQNMVRAYEMARSAYANRDGEAASSYAADGRRYKEESQRLVAERRRLVDEIKSARAAHEAVKPSFQQAKNTFTACKQAYKSAKQEHERAQAEFKRAKAESEAATQAFKARLEQVKSEACGRRRVKDGLLEKAGVPRRYHDSATVSTDADGNVNIYFGGMGEPNGPGHGHYVMNKQGKVTYRRKPFDPHGAQNFTEHSDNHRGSSLYNRRARCKEPRGVETRDNLTKDRSGTFYDRTRDISLHVTQYYDDNYRHSWDADGNTDAGHHWTNQDLPYGHPDRNNPPKDAK